MWEQISNNLVILLIFLAVMALIVLGILLFSVAIPWFLASLPILWLLTKAEDHGLISGCWRSLKRKSEPPTTTHFRIILLFNLKGVGLISAFLCWKYAGTSYMAWWLIPMTLFALALRLLALLASESTVGRLQKATSENLLELFVIALVRLAVLSCALWRLQTIPLDSFTLHTLRTWDERVQHTHEWFETHMPGSKVFVFILGLLFFLRVINRFIALLSGFGQFLVSSLVNGVKWSQRLATVVAVAATLTILSTDPEGPSTGIGLQLREAQKKYDDYQTVLSDHTEKALRRTLV